MKYAYSEKMEREVSYMLTRAGAEHPCGAMLSLVACFERFAEELVEMERREQWIRGNGPAMMANLRAQMRGRTRIEGDG